ncbi:MAG: ATP-binding protein [Clostridiaceae bacterium]
MKFISALEIALIVVESLIFLVFYVTLVSKRDFVRTNKLKCVIFCVFYVTLAYFISLYLPMGYHTIVILLATILLLSFITRTNVYNAAVIVVIATLFISVVDMINSAIFVAIFQMDLNEMLLNTGDYQYQLFAWTSKAIQAALAILFFKFNNDRIRIALFKSNHNQYMFAIMQLLLMAIFIASVNYSTGGIKDKALYNFMLVSLYALSIILSVFDFREREQMLELINKKKNLEEYVKNLEDVINVIRREKHDFMNHIQTIFAICKLGKPNAVESIDNYLKRLTSDLSSSYTFYETGNDYIDGLLAIKSNICFENEINLVVKIGAKFTSAKADDSDIAGIVGNIVNNSIECLKDLPASYEKKIEFVTGIRNNMFYLMIENNGPEIPKSIVNLIFEKGYTTKSESVDHGFGLFIAKQLAAKNNGSINVDSTPESTKFIISFNAKESENAGLGRYAAV